MKTLKTSAFITGLLLGAAAFLAPQATVAQEPQSEETNPHARSGFWFNGGVGYGSLGCDGCASREGGIVVSLGAGGTLSQHVLLGAGIDGWTKEEDGTRLTASSLLATLRFYTSETSGFFLRGGLGFGTVEVQTSSFGTENENGGAALLGLGYDFRIGDNVSLTPYLNGVGVTTENTEVNFNQLGLSITVH